MEDILLGDDGNFVASASGDVETVTDLECLIQDVKHEHLTFPGDLWTDKEYGIGIQWFLHAEDTDLNRLELQQQMKNRLSRDNRIDAESIKTEILTWERDKIKTRLTFAPAVDAFDEDGEVPEDQADIVLTISQDGISFGG